jgi:hypothetical protein
MNMLNHGLNAASPLHDFCHRRREALRNAACLLAGQRGGRLVADVLDTLTMSTAPNRRTLRNLIELHRILSLQGTEDPGSEQAVHFAMIEPGDPVVEEICLLSDGLLDALRAYADLKPAFELDIAA